MIFENKIEFLKLISSTRVNANYVFHESFLRILSFILSPSALSLNALKHSFTSGTRNICVYLWFPLRNQSYQIYLKKSKISKFNLMKWD